MLPIVILEDDSDAVRRFADYADGLDDLKLAAVCRSAKDALSAIREHLPRAVILDLELQRGAGSGLEVLDRLPETGYKPFVVVVTNILSDPIYDRARSLGADYIMWKHQGGYSEKYVLDFIRGMKDSIQGSGSLPQTTEPPRGYEERVRRIIKAEMLDIGVSPRLAGYGYLVDAIWLTVSEPRKRLYDAVASLNHVTKTCVERALQNAIDKAWRETDIDILNERYRARIRSDRGVPTILEFVLYYADKVKGML